MHDNNSPVSIPYDDDAEKRFLGAVLANNEIFHYSEERISVDCFYVQTHRIIFERMDLLIKKRGLVATVMTVKSALKGYDFDLDIEEYLTNIMESAIMIPDIANIVEILHDLYIRRCLIDYAQGIITNAYKNDIVTSAHHDLEVAEQKLFELAIRGDRYNNMVPLQQSLSSASKIIEAAYNSDSSIRGVPTGFHALDNLLCGLQKSDLIIIAARPSMGKTALAVNIAMNAAEFLKENRKKGKDHNENGNGGVAFFSLEMSAEQLAMRMMSIKAGVRSELLRSGKLGQKEFHDIMGVVHSMHDLSFYIDDTPALQIATLRTNARRLYRKKEIDLIIVDYLQLVRNSSCDNRVAEVSEVTQGLKAIAKELNIPVIALSQLSRSVEQREDKHPQLSDLRDSGSIEQDADVVMFIYREAYYELRKQPDISDQVKYAMWQEKMNAIQDTAEVIIAKQRNGPIGNIKLFFDTQTTQFRDFEDYNAFTNSGVPEEEFA